jgi:hypothetical protein
VFRCPPFFVWCFGNVLTRFDVLQKPCQFIFLFKINEILKTPPYFTPDIFRKQATPCAQAADFARHLQVPPCNDCNFTKTEYVGMPADS